MYSAARCVLPTAGETWIVTGELVAAATGDASVTAGISRNCAGEDAEPVCGSAGVPNRTFRIARIVRTPACSVDGMVTRRLVFNTESGATGSWSSNAIIVSA